MQNLIGYLSAGDSLEESLHYFPSVSREQAVAALAQPGEALEQVIFRGEPDSAEPRELVLTRGGEAVAKIISLHRQREPRRPSSARGSVLFMADDFDATPEDIKDCL